MSYLIPKDYSKSIQADQLTQITASDSSLITDAENLAYETVIENLTQKYDINAELQDTPQHDKTVSYKANDRVYINAPLYVQATSYTAGAIVLFGTSVYICVNPTTGVFVPGDWTLIGSQFQIFTAKYPAQAFQLMNFYKVGDIVFWKNNTYTCKVATIILGHETALQYGQYKNLPLNNVFPDDTTDGPTYWGTPTAYAVPGNTNINNPTYWSIGDNRCQRLVSVLVDLVLRAIHKRIAPRNIPDLREKAFDEAIRWLKGCAKGEVTPKLSLLQPAQGARIRYGGNIKNINTY